VEFRLLGAVEARIGDTPVDLGPPRQRCVLAALLVDVNHPVSVERLLDRVWGDRRPFRASGTLYTYLSRLRQVLATGHDNGRPGIVHRSGGYVLTADPASIDLHRFRRLVANARACADDEAAAAPLEEALSLWRGEPFGGLDSPWLNQIRAELDAERRAAELYRNELESRPARRAAGRFDHPGRCGSAG
jgi:DNA-binding SARP family transcriptional activator